MQDNPGATTEKQALDGYPKLARLMSLSSETAIFRRFGELNMLNLLRLQAELHDLEHQLQEIRDEDSQSNDPIRASYVTDFRLMRDWRETGDSLQYDLLVSIGEKLQEYSIVPLLGPILLSIVLILSIDLALSQTRELTKAEIPTRREIGFLRSWLVRPSMGNNFLNDREQTIWEIPNTSDLITLFPRHLEKDAFTSLLNGALLDIYHGIWGHRRKVRYLWML